MSGQLDQCHTQSPRIRDWLRLAGTSGIILSLLKQGTSELLPRTTPRQLPSISRSDHPTTPQPLQGPAPVLHHPYRKAQSLLCFTSCPLPLILSLEATEKSLAPSSSHPPFRNSHPFLRSPSIPFYRLDRLNSPSSPVEMIQALHHLRGPLQDSLQYLQISFVLGSAKLDTALQILHG